MTIVPAVHLLNNVALLLALGVAFGTLLPRSDKWRWKFILGFFLGVIAIGVMANPWKLAPGIIFDTRTILLSVSGMFFGLIPTLIAIAMAGLFRFYLGGVGTFTGISWIVCSGLMGVLWVRIRKLPPYKYPVIDLYLFGFIVHLVMLLLQFTMPNNLAIPNLQSITLPVLLIFPPATVLLAKLLAGQQLQFHSQIELDRSERQYRELVQNSQVILLQIDSQGIITFINDYGENLFGYGKNELLGKSIFETIVAKTDLAGQDLKTKIKDILTCPDGYLEHENENTCSDGRRLRVFWKNTPLLDSSGRPIGIQSLGSDVTELRRAETILKIKEKQLQRLVDVTPIALVIVGQDQNVVYVNQKFTQLFGYKLEELPNIEAWWLLAFPDVEYRAQVKHNWDISVARTIGENVPFAPQETRVKCKDHTFRDVVALFSWIGDQGIVVFKDVSQERALDRMKSEFIATAAHELRTPLTAVRGFTELLLNENGFTQEEQHEYLSIVCEKTEVLEKIIDDLLDLGRVESGQLIVLNKKICNIDELVHSAVDCFQKEFRDHCFNLSWPEQELCEIEADPLKIGQVLDNLLSNAVKFSPHDRLIRVFGAVTNGEVRISVQDEGSGMASDQVAKVFDKFYRVDSSDTAPAGFGLGLAITKGIIEAHGGRILVESEVGKGTKVAFSLPLVNKQKRFERE